MKWTAERVGHAVHHQLLHRKCIVVIPNCYHTGYEADLLGMTTDGRCIDIEVKISRQDLRADYAKDKWWIRSWGETWSNFVGPPRPPREWPPGIWKHYYALPVAIWTADLFDCIPPCSGVLLLEDDVRTRSVRIHVERRAKPNRKAKPISADNALTLARLCSLRMWDALDARDRAASECERLRQVAEAHPTP